MGPSGLESDTHAPTEPVHFVAVLTESLTDMTIAFQAGLAGWNAVTDH